MKVAVYAPLIWLPAWALVVYLVRMLLDKNAGLQSYTRRILTAVVCICLNSFGLVSLLSIASLAVPKVLRHFLDLVRM